jgi:NAD(P)-dependent dehydrogenase (short-subunit alcohol dehydrogenase family)
LVNTDIPLDAEFDMVTLKDRVAIITGASGGLGRVVTREFSERGARLALFDRSSERLKELVSDLKLTEDRYLLIASDLTGPEAARSAAKDVMAKFGRAEIVLNFIGGFTGGKQVVELAEDDLSDMLKQHVWTTFYLAQAFVPHLVANRWGRFLVISSPRALNPRGNNAAYAIGKAGEEVLVLSLAQELKDTGVTANVILVRSIDVGHLRDREPTPENASWTTPEEIAAAIMYLCSDEARMTTGARIPLYGA